ncbi:hypothetical protein SDC9_194039 [bioreactor metagenome]|uniref:Uncharacterized protein n=1 Tax=bioreactor metagenome TaxID=1076179 RepID=A0A645IGG3_9ZZZZ
MAHRIDRGDPQGEANCGVGSRASPLGQNVLLPTKVNDVFDNQEVAGESQFGDNFQLVFDGLPRGRVLLGGTVALTRPPVG